MANNNLYNIFGGEYYADSVVPLRQEVSPDQQVREAMVNAGIEPPDHIIMDGRIHRFSTDHKKDKSAWYIIFHDGIPAGIFGDWRSGLEVPWSAKCATKMTPMEEANLRRRMAEAKALRDAERDKAHELAADVVMDIWSPGALAHPDHDYLKEKGIQPNGARITGDGRLMVPLYNSDGELCSVQYIASNGEKRYHPGAPTRGAFWWIGEVNKDKPLFVAEGFATAATIYEVTGCPVIVAYSASNLTPVVGLMRETHGPNQKIVIVADNDASGTGQKYADQASAKYGATVIIPPTEGDANDYLKAGNDLLTLLLPPPEEWLISADDFSRQPKPISWLIKNWLQGQAMMMLHGPSGAGKSFCVMDMACHIAAGIPSWRGNKVNQGQVVYLAGEGHNGLRARVAAWKHYYQIERLDLWISKSGCDLDTQEGYSKVLESIKDSGIKPSLVVVDTLHRFLKGDENSAQDTKVMVDYCDSLSRYFSCSVLLIHHTGVGEGAKHRGRGSSAWKGVLDIEISLNPAEDHKPIEIIQRKSKDTELAEPMYGYLHRVDIPNWIDEDGDQVYSAVMVSTDYSHIEIDDMVEELLDAERAKNLFKRIWYATGLELYNGCPYITRSASRAWLLDNGPSTGLKVRTDNEINHQLTSEDEDTFAGTLIKHGLARFASHGIAIIGDWIED